MKKTAENRFPHSATLFRFCKQSLERKYSGRVKVIDQDVGALLKFDPADCSHWKKGKKNIRVLSALQSLATQLGLSEELIYRVAAGELDLGEALFELDYPVKIFLKPAELEEIKKNHYANLVRWNTENKDDLFEIKSDLVEELAASLLTKAQVAICPVYLDEVLRLVKGFELQQSSTLEKDYSVTEESEGRTVFAYKSNEMKPYLRFLIAKNLYLHCLRNREAMPTGSEAIGQLLECSPEVQEIHANLFALNLLAPRDLLVKEWKEANFSKNTVDELAKRFWLTQSLMQERILSLY